jgi:SLOG cluster4 family
MDKFLSLVGGDDTCGVVGSSKIKRVEIERIARILTEYICKPGRHIISGGDIGVDKVVHLVAVKEGCIFTEIMSPHDKRCGIKHPPTMVNRVIISKYGEERNKNKVIVNNSDCMVVFWNGVSLTTQNIIDYILLMNIPMVLVLLGKPSDNSIDLFSLLSKSHPNFFLCHINNFFSK